MIFVSDHTILPKGKVMIVEWNVAVKQSPKDEQARKEHFFAVLLALFAGEENHV